MVSQDLYSYLNTINEFSLLMPLFMILSDLMIPRVRQKQEKKSFQMIKLGWLMAYYMFIAGAYTIRKWDLYYALNLKPPGPFDYVSLHGEGSDFHNPYHLLLFTRLVIVFTNIMIMITNLLSILYSSALYHSDRITNRISRRKLRRMRLAMLKIEEPYMRRNQQ